MDDRPLRSHLVRLLAWEDAHVDFDAALAGLPAELRGTRPDGLPHSPWQLLEHMRLAQRDILDFCTSASYRAPRWPEDYWPDADAAPSDEEWEGSIAAFRSDLEAVKELAELADLLAPIPQGGGQTYLREILLVADHNAYHLGQIIVVRRLLGAWPRSPLDGMEGRP